MSCGFCPHLLDKARDHALTWVATVTAQCTANLRPVLIMEEKWGDSELAEGGQP